MKFLQLLSIPLLASVAACGGGGDKKPLVDAPPQQIDAPPAVTCTAPAAAAEITNPFLAYNADASMETTGNQEAYRFIGDLNADPRPDWIWIELYEGPAPDFTYANFPATPFTVQIAGGELAYATCSVCVSLTTDVNLANEDELEYVDDYFATGGSVTFTTLTATNIAGTMSNVTFDHVDFSMDGQAPNASGCKSTLASATFEGMVMPQARKGGRKLARVRLTPKR